MTAARPTRMSLGLPLLVGALFAASSAPFAAADPDLFWHLATARETLARGLVRTDLFSWTVAGSAVPADQWLGQLAWYGAYQVGEWRGVVGLRTIGVAILVALIVTSALLARRHGPLVAALAAIPAILLSRFSWTERPELFGTMFFAGALVLVRAGRSGSDRAMIALPALLLVWANVHGSYALGAVLVVVACLEGAWSERPRRRVYALVATCSLAATFATPALGASWTNPGLHLLHPPRDIQEWAVPDVGTAAGALYVFTLALVLGCAMLVRAVRPRDVIVLVPTALLSLTATRHMQLFAIAAAPYLAAHGPDALRTVRDALRLDVPFPRLPAATPATARADALVGVAAVLLIVGSVAIAPRAPDLTNFPVAAVEALPPGPGSFNAYDWGGFLIWYAPRTPVFIDGRLVPYLDRTLDEYKTIIGARPGWRALVDRLRIRTLLVHPGDPVAVRAADLGWRVRRASAGFIVVEVP